MEDRRGQIERFIADASGAAEVRVDRIARLDGGAIQENWGIDAVVDGTAMDLVVRKNAPSGVSVSHGRAEEFALLRAAFGAGVAVPEPLWLCTDPAVMDDDFYIMRRVAGVAARHVVAKQLSASGGEEVAARLGAELARIHTIVPPRADLGFLGAVSTNPGQAAIDLYRAMIDRLGPPRPVLEWGLRGLERMPPSSAPPALCHRDYRTGNYMVADGALTGVLDWEFAGWGDPHEDIAWFCAACWRSGNFELEAGGIARRSTFYDAYERASGRRIDPRSVAYWEVMAHIRWAAIALEQGERHVSGAEPSLNLALTGRQIAEIEYEVLPLLRTIEDLAA